MRKLKFRPSDDSIPGPAGGYDKGRFCENWSTFGSKCPHNGSCDGLGRGRFLVSEVHMYSSLITARQSAEPLRFLVLTLIARSEDCCRAKVAHKTVEAILWPWLSGKIRQTFYIASSSLVNRYRGTLLIRNTPPAGPYSSPMPRDAW